MIPAGRLSNRVLAIVSAAAILYLLFSWSTRGTLESQWLVTHMNANTPPLAATAVKSTFDWAGVRYQHPPGKLQPFPRPAGRALPRVQHRFRLESTQAKRVRE